MGQAMFDICMKFLNILQQIYLKQINENQILRQMSKTTFRSREKTEQSFDVARTHWKKESAKLFFWQRKSSKDGISESFGKKNVIEE